MNQTFAHTTVMLNPAIEHLLGPADGCYVDATFGRGGHTRLLLSSLGPQGQVIAFDRDPQAIEVAQGIGDARLSLRHQSFAHMAELPEASVDGLLMDLGVSSPQIDDPSRGFSFRFDGPLDMRMDTTRGQTVAQWLETAEIDDIAEVIRDYGEERFAVQIAKAIAARRQTRGPIATTAELAELVAGAVKTREPGKDPATRTFQAFRIFINAELEELEQALAASLRILKPGGKLVVISFHSLEDRAVKQFIRTHSTEVYDRRMPFAPVPKLPLKDLGRVKPTAEEIELNARSRSAVMRVAQRTAEG